MIKQFEVRFSGENGYQQTVNRFPRRSMAVIVMTRMQQENPRWKVWIDPVAWSDTLGQYVICREALDEV